MKNAKKISLKINNLCFLLFFLCVSSAFAVSASKQNSFEFSSETASCQRSGNENICTYVGNVRINQGLSIVEAPKVTVYKNYDKIYKMEAVGKRAHYFVVLDENHKTIDALADSIILYPDKSLMVLNGDGQITEDKNTFIGPYLEYVFEGTTSLKGN